MMYFNIAFNLCDTMGFLRAFYLVRVGLSVIRYAVPIILIAMIMKDLYKNVLNPDDKEGPSKIVKKLVAAVIVFLIPTVINFFLYIVDFVMGADTDSDYKASSCYTNATSSCIDKIESYLDCSDEKDASNNKNCQAYRRCNEYKLVGSCNVRTSEIDSCSRLNNAYGSKYRIGE